MCMTTPAAAEPRRALEPIAEAIVRLRRTDTADTVAALLAAWHGFGIAEAAGGLLAEDNPDDAVLAHNARPVMTAVATRLRQAPSLPYTDPVEETVDVSPRPHTDRRTTLNQLDDPEAVADLSVVGNVRRGILDLALELNTLLARVAEMARDRADRQACAHGMRLAYELSHCWEGRLGSFLNDSRDLAAAGRAPQRTTTSEMTKRTKKRT